MNIAEILIKWMTFLHYKIHCKDEES